MKMTDDTLEGIVSSYISECRDYLENEVGRKRSLAYDYYWGKPFGNEQEGRSQVISQDVAQIIDSAVPAIVKTFVATDRAVEFTPRNAEDVEGAEQATDLCNYVFFSQNNGFQLVHDCVKDGLLQITGMFRWYWDKEEQVSEETYMGLDEGSWTMLLSDPNVEVIGHSAMPMQGPAGPDGPDGQAQVMVLHNAKVRKKKEAGKVKVCVVPPEEQLISPSARTMDVDEHRFIGILTRKTKSELLEMGYSEADIADCGPADSSTLTSEERQSRRDRLQSVTDLFDSNSADPSQTVYDYAETYVLVDFDGDGLAERRRVCVCGTKVLHNEVVDHIPLAYWTPKIMPHEPIGMSMAEEVMDIQYTKSMLWRNSFDSLYLSVHPRMSVVEGQVNLDDVLTVRPGGIIRMNQPGMVTPVEIPFVGQQAFPMIEYLDAEGEARTGVSRLFQGLDPNAINKTATGVNALMNAAQARIELTSRSFAECAFKPLFKGIIYLLQQSQMEPLATRLRNKFVSVDPRVWSNEYDMAVNVGLGTGTKDQQLQHLMALGMDLQAIGASPFAQQLMDAKKVFNYVEKKAELMGFKDASIFVNYPEGTQPPQPPKPPEVQVAEIEAQTSMQKGQMEMQGKQGELQAKGQQDAQRMQMEAAFKERELQQTAALERYKADLKAQTEIQIATIRAQVDAQRDFNRPVVNG